MQTIEELKDRISSTSWFSRFGEPDYAGQVGFIHLPDLEEWRHVTGMLPNEPVPKLIDKGMKWLPTSRDEIDPIHGNSLKEKTKALGKEKEFSLQALDVYKLTLTSLRPIDGLSCLKVGASSFTEAARGAATFAARQATYEILLGSPGFWCRAIEIFHSGHWPFGLMPDGTIVVL